MRLFAATIGVALLSSLLGPVSQASAREYAPAPGAIFNYPRSGHEPSLRIINHVLQAILHTPRGATIQLASYSYDRTDLTNALIKAHQRGVNVQMVLNDNIVTRETKRLRGIIGANPDRRSFVLVCRFSCRGVRGNQHMKFFLFSRTGPASNVVMVGSSNLTTFAAFNQWNDMVTFTEERALHDLYAGMFVQLARDRLVQHQKVRRTIGNIESTFTGQQSVTARTDLVIQRLNKVSCVAAAGTGQAGRTVIRISAYGWHGSRGVYIANKVASLKRQGCNIRIIVSGANRDVRKILRTAEIPLRSASYDIDDEGVINMYDHLKYMTVDGTYAGKATAAVWTGSENWSDQSFRNDEVVVQVSRRSLHSRYIANFKYMWKHDAY